MDTKINDLESCAIAPVIDALVPDDYQYIDNNSTCGLLDRVYQYVYSHKRISVEGAIMLLNKMSIIYKSAITYATFNRIGISSKNRSGIDAYCCDFASACECCVNIDDPEFGIFERAQIPFYQDDNAEIEYRKEKLEEYSMAFINAYNLRHIFMNYPIQNLQNRSDFSRKNVNYGN